MSGQAVRTAADSKRFGAFVQAYGKDISDAKRKRYCRLSFYTQPTNGEAKKNQGWGDEVKVDGSDLYQSGSAHTNVGVDLYTLGKLKPVVQDNMVVVDEQGRVVVCGD